MQIVVRLRYEWLMVDGRCRRPLVDVRWAAKSARLEFRRLARSLVDIVSNIIIPIDLYYSAVRQRCLCASSGKPSSQSIVGGSCCSRRRRRLGPVQNGQQVAQKLEPPAVPAVLGHGVGHVPVPQQRVALIDGPRAARLDEVPEEELRGLL